MSEVSQLVGGEPQVQPSLLQRLCSDVCTTLPPRQLHRLWHTFLGTFPFLSFMGSRALSLNKLWEEAVEGMAESHNLLKLLPCYPEHSSLPSLPS